MRFQALPLSSRSAWPPHPSTRFGTGKLRLRNFLFEHILKSIGDAFRRAAFDDVSVWQAVAEELRKTSRPRQTDIVGQPNRLFGQTRWPGPVCNESRVSCFALDAVQCALLPWQQRHLCSRDMHRSLPCRVFVMPSFGNRLHSST